jgi:hypothetical protein
LELSRKQSESFKEAASATRAIIVEFGAYLEALTQLRQPSGPSVLMRMICSRTTLVTIPFACGKVSPEVPLPVVPPFDLPTAIARHERTWVPCSGTSKARRMKAKTGPTLRTMDPVATMCTSGRTVATERKHKRHEAGVRERTAKSS